MGACKSNGKPHKIGRGEAVKMIDVADPCRYTRFQYTDSKNMDKSTENSDTGLSLLSLMSLNMGDSDNNDNDDKDNDKQKIRSEHTESTVSRVSDNNDTLLELSPCTHEVFF